MGTLMPGATDVAGFWRCLVEGRDLITDVPEGRWLVEDFYDPDPTAPDHTYCRRGAFLPEVDLDAAHYRIPPNALPATDSTQLLALIVAEATLADCGALDVTDRERVSVIIGTGQLKLSTHMANRVERPVWRKALRELGLPEPQVTAACDAIADHYVPWQEATFPGLLGNVVAGRIAHRFDLHGTNCTVDAACASSLAALSMGIDELALGRADVVLAGGVDATNEPLAYLCFSKTPALSPTGDCRPFSDDADGTILGEGLAMFALTRLGDAEAAGLRIYAVIRGLGSSSDGRGSAIYAPVPAGQARAIRRAYWSAGYEPDTVQLVEAHGTGTAAGDAAEFSALREVFDASGRPERQWCALGSVKSQIGHTKCAAGAAGLLKTALALHHRVLPPTIKVRRPDPRLDVSSSPFYLNTRARPWIATPDHPRRAAVSSFGFGGTNFHVTIEEYAGERRARTLRAAPSELLLFSAASPRELPARLAGDDLAELSRRSQDAFDPTANVRLAIVAASVGDLHAKLDRALARPEHIAAAADGITLAVGPPAAGPIGFLFPGQGSQYVGMSADVTMHLPVAQATWDAAAASTPGLASVVFPPPAFDEHKIAEQEGQLTETRWAQPALAATSLVMLEILRAVGVTPSAVAGHSLGELVALHAAGVFDAATLMALARRRAEVMAAASVVPGAMLAVLASPVEVDITGLEDVWFANHNGPAEFVLSGTANGIDMAERRLRDQRVTVRRLRVATAFHSPLVAGAVTPLRDYLEGLAVVSPQMAVFSNADATPYPTGADQIRDRLANQLAAPVRFADTITAMYRHGVRIFVEVGAGATLSGMVDRALVGAEHSTVALDRRGVNGLTRLQQALGQLAVLGVALDLTELWGEPAPPAATPTKPSMLIRIGGRGIGNPYPPPGGAAALPPPNSEPTDDPPPDRSPQLGPHPAPALPAAPARASRTMPLTEFDGAGTGLEGPARPATSDDRLRVVEELGRQVALAHESYQRAMTDGHLAFLQTAETSLAALAGPWGEAAAGMPTAAGEPAAAPWQGHQSEVATAPAEPIPRDPTAVAPTTTAGALSLVLSIIGEVTGYPIEVLGPEMDLETDLGIDSIKRVEILAALLTRVPSLADVVAVGSDGANEFLIMRTVAALAARLATALGLGVAAPAPPDGPGPAESSQRPYPMPEVTIARRVVRTTGAQTTGAQTTGARGPGSALRGFGAGPVVITDDGAGVAAALTEQLHDRGVAAAVVAEAPADARSVILLEGLREVRSVEEALVWQRKAFRSARAVAAGMARDGACFVTVQDTGGDFGMSGADADRAWLGGLAALARTAAWEWPRTTVKAIDCQRGGRDAAAVASAILTELFTGGSTPDVGLTSNGNRVTLGDTAAPPTGGPPWDPGSGVLVVTGGARGITSAVVRAVAARFRPRLVLLGRTRLEIESEDVAGAADEAALLSLFAAPGVPPAHAKRRARAVLAAREVRGTLDELARLDVRARYVTADVTDRSALNGALDEVRRMWGPITGIVHGAGVLADRSIADKSDAQFDAVFGTKVAGLQGLLEATATDPLRLIVAFGSIVARIGNAGQCDYAMANETVTHVLISEAARRPGCLVRSLMWGPWDGGMVNESLAALFHDRGVPLIPMAVGADAFCAELAAGPGAVPVVLVADGGLPLGERAEQRS